MYYVSLLKLVVLGIRNFDQVIKKFSSVVPIATKIRVAAIIKFTGGSIFRTPIIAKRAKEVNKYLDRESVLHMLIFTIRIQACCHTGGIKLWGFDADF